MPSSSIIETSGKFCAADGCKAFTRAKGLCGKHYQRFRTHGTLEKLERSLLPWRQCTIKGCAKPSRTRRGGTCEAHYARYRRNSNYDPPVYGRWSVNGDGYMMRLDRTHPVAAKSGYLFQHRAVLFDAIGYGPHQCHWCGSPVDWRSPSPRKLVVDHLDGCKINNEVQNLVPSCHRCNSTRGLFQHWVLKHQDDPFLWALYEASRTA